MCKGILKKSEFWKNIAAIVASVTTIVCAIIAVCVANTAITNINQKQEVVTLEPRDGDVIINEDGNYKLVQLIKKEDIVISDFIQETRYEFNEMTDKKRVELFRGDDTSDWKEKDGFKYTLEYISINPDKVMNLLGNIEEIKIHFDIYESKDITTRLTPENTENFVGIEKVLISGTEEEIVTSYTGITSDKFYVTNNFPNNGINFMKLRLEINYSIPYNNGKDIHNIKTELILSDWIEIVEKY